eukprot:1370268-Pleurochrysis_carterae.AAC.1
MLVDAVGRRDHVVLIGIVVQAVKDAWSVGEWSRAPPDDQSMVDFAAQWTTRMWNSTTRMVSL